MQSPRDRTALFNELVVPNLNLIYKLCQNHADNKSDVRDLYQENLVNLFEFIDTYKPNLRLTAWIITIVVRKIREIQKKKYKLPLDLKDNIYDWAIFSEKDVSVPLEYEDIVDYIDDEMLEAMQSISTKHTKPFVLHHVFKHKLKEIQKVLHDDGDLPSDSVSTVKSRVHLAKKKLAESLDKEEMWQGVMLGRVGDGDYIHSEHPPTFNVRVAKRRYREDLIEQALALDSHTDIYALKTSEGSDEFIMDHESFDKDE